MKLEISGLEATVTSIVIASFFVISLYLWIPFEKKDPKKEKKEYDENSSSEIMKRITSVSFSLFTFPSGNYFIEFGPLVDLLQGRS